MQILPVIVVGYSSITIQPGYHLFTATFEDCAGGEYNLDNVVVLNEDGSKWDVKDATTVPVVITKMTTDGKGKYDSNQTYSYRHLWVPVPPPLGTDSGLGWYTGVTTTRIGNNITIGQGEAVSINNQMNYDIIVEFPSPIKEEAK